MQPAGETRMLKLIGRSSSERARLFRANEFNFGGAALTPDPRQRSALANDPHAVALDGDAGRSFACHLLPVISYLSSLTCHGHCSIVVSLFHGCVTVPWLRHCSIVGFEQPVPFREFAHNETSAAALFT